jgi:hypothetical protein
MFMFHSFRTKSARRYQPDEDNRLSLARRDAVIASPKNEWERIETAVRVWHLASPVDALLLR